MLVLKQNEFADLLLIYSVFSFSLNGKVFESLGVQLGNFCNFWNEYQISQIDELMHEWNFFDFRVVVIKMHQNINGGRLCILFLNNFIVLFLNFVANENEINFLGALLWYKLMAENWTVKLHRKCGCWSFL